MEDPLYGMLSRLKLTGIRDRLDNLLDEASKGNLTLRETLSFLCTYEIGSKDDRRNQMGISMAKFPCVKTLDQFDFGEQPALDPKQIRELATGRWIGHGDSLLLLGPPGVGKTHLAIALGREAIRSGYTVLFCSATSLMAQLVKGHSDRFLKEQLDYFGKPKLLIIDELGYLPFERSAAHLFFQLVCRRYERGSTLITSNKRLDEWGDLFGDTTVATAILDRLLHHSHVVTIPGESYRLREKRRSGLVKSQRELIMSKESEVVK
jgi:DNA replication protein DnaC